MADESMTKQYCPIIQYYCFYLCIKYLFIGELCYRLWLIYDKKELKKNNLECGISSEEVNRTYIDMQWNTIS